MKSVFDFGMFDASDTRYYIEEGYQVVAVEANPSLAQSASRALCRYVESGQLKIINAAISSNNDPVTLTICGDDLGSSSVYEGNVASRLPVGEYRVPGVKVEDLFEEHGIPHYLKVDIEGADGICVRALSRSVRPGYLSFEIGADFEELLDHATSIGFKEFKIINQCNFRELTNERALYDRLMRKLMRMAGYIEPQYVRRNGRYFKVGHSSGPVPWESDGAWVSRAELDRKWARRCALPRKNEWYDLHAR